MIYTRHVWIVLRMPYMYHPNSTLRSQWAGYNRSAGLLEKVITEHPIDKHRLYAHGTSNGGNMVYRLAQERPERFRAMAAVVAAMPELGSSL